MKGIRIRPEKEGLKTSLFDLEADVMDTVWSQGWEWFSVGDVHGVLKKARKIAYTTVMTTVSRLRDKELLERKPDGRRYLYRSLMSRAEFVRAMTREVIESLPPLGQHEAVALLAEQVAEADAEELDRLEALIKQKRRDLSR